MGMRVLVACESSGAVRDAFRARGHDAWSCDLLPSNAPSPFHIQDDVRHVVSKPQWVGADMLIAFPPCTHLAVSGARWWPQKRQEQADALEFVRWLMELPIPRIAIENPVGLISTAIRKPDQIIQPYQFGHEARKTTCLWLKNLPLLKPTKLVGQGEIHTTKSGRRLPKWYNLPPGPDRWKVRSATFPGIATAMADQWGATPDE